MASPPHGFQAASDSARERCHQDGKRLPYYWYEESALLWKQMAGGGEVWRVPNVTEVELLMGFPSGYTLVPSDPFDAKSPKIPDDRRWRMIANARQVPCHIIWNRALGTAQNEYRDVACAFGCLGPHRGPEVRRARRRRARRGVHGGGGPAREVPLFLLEI